MNTKPTRCKEGLELMQAWRKNYDAVVRAKGDWEQAFFDPRYWNHAKTCAVCTAYSDWKRNQRYIVLPELADGTEHSPYIIGGEIAHPRSAQNHNNDEIPY